MSTDIRSNRATTHSVETKASSYDKLNAILIASIMLFGFLFATLFLIWITTVFDFSRRTEGPIPLANDAGDSKPKGDADDILPPGVEEFPEVDTPQLANALEAVTDAISSVRSSIEKRSGSAAKMGKGSGYGSREGGPGTGGDGVPEHLRWKIKYEASDINMYAEQLSYFDIDIGVIHKTKQDIWRLQDVGGGATVGKSSRETEDKAMYFTHEERKLGQWDQQLCRRAGIDLSNTIQVQFYPEVTRQRLRQAEAAALVGTNKELSEVRNTFFEVESGGGGFVFKVVDFKYR